MATRKSETQRASNYRRRQREGEKLTKEESDWLAQYDATKRKPGRPPGPAKEMPTPIKTTVDESEDDDADEEIPTPAPPAAPPAAAAPPPPPPGPAPKLPSPPKIMIGAASDGPRASAGNWRDKYKQGDKGASTGREHTCLVVSSYWLGALANMAESLKAAGVEPIINPESLAGSIVLTVDELLPDHVELTPRMHAMGGSTALLVQRFMRRDEIAKAQAKAKERQEYQDWKEHRKDPPAPEPPAKAAEAAVEPSVEPVKPEEKHAQEPNGNPVAVPSQIILNPRERVIFDTESEDSVW